MPQLIRYFCPVFAIYVRYLLFMWWLILSNTQDLYKPRAGYMTQQRHISWSHRSIVVDWMYGVRKLDGWGTLNSTAFVIHITVYTCLLSTNFIIME